MNTKIILADDHRIMRQGLRSLLEKHEGMKVIGEAGDGRAALRLVRETSPNIVIMDIAMPVLNGIETTRLIASRYPKTKVIALSMHSDRQFVLGMFQAGASAYLVKDCAFEELTRAVHAVLRHGTYLSSRITDSVIKDYLRRSPEARRSAFDVLTQREREVLQLLAEGGNTRDIAADLKIGVKTAETHRQQVMKKLGIQSIAELTKYAIREGLTSLA